MNLNKLNLALSLALFALPLSAMAQDQTASTAPQPATQDDSTQADAQQSEAPAKADDEAATESNLTWNLSATSDYVFRGVSQSNRDPALQGGFDYAFGKSGVYAGTWGSNIDFADRNGPDLEIDTYIGWNHDVSDDWNVDVMLTRYNYFGSRKSLYGDIDYNELIGKVKYHDMLTFTLGYTNDYANTSDRGLYYSVGGNWDVGNDVKLNASIGYTDIDNTDTYTDWNLGVSRKFGPVEAALNYYDTDASGPRLSDTVVLSFKIGG